MHPARFTEAAGAFCALLEPHPVADAAAWRAAVFAALADLYSAAVIGPRTATGLEGAAIPHERWREVYAFAASLLGPQTLYSTFSDPVGDLTADHGPVVGDLADDLSDIWRDLRSDPSLFAEHWGLHAVAALRVLHRIVLEGE